MLYTYREDSSAKEDSCAAKLPSVASAADAVISAIDATELAAFTALRAPAEDEDTTTTSSSTDESTHSSSSSSKLHKEQKIQRDAEKSALLEALKTKLKVQLEIAEVSSLVSCVHCSLSSVPKSKLKAQLEIADVCCTVVCVCDDIQQQQKHGGLAKMRLWWNRLTEAFTLHSPQQ